MNRLQFLGNFAIWGITFNLSILGVIFLIGHEQSVLAIFLMLIPAFYSFYRLLLSGYKRVIDIFPGKDMGLLLIGFIIIISIVPFGSLLLLLLPGNLLGKKDENRS